MLVLSRKKNESIVIDDRIKITVVEIRGDKVRLGVDAPKEVPVHRQEVYDAIHREIAGNRPQEIGVQSTRPPCPNCTELNPIINGTTYVCEGCGHSWVIPA